MSKTDWLLEWAKENGAELSPNLQFKELSSDNYGAISTAADSKASISIPRQLIITSDRAQALFSEETYTKSTNRLALVKLFLSYARTKETFYKPYVDSLPSLVAIDSPYTWPPEDLKLIEGTNLGNSLRENIASIVEEWWCALNLVPDEIQKPEEHFINMKFYYEFKFYQNDDLYSYFTETPVANWTAFPNYLWATLIFKSRAFPAYIIDSSVAKNESMLLPVVDLLNHEPSAKVEWTGTDGNFKFETAKCGAAGSQVFNNYGLKGNEELLLGYGFAINPNHNDSVALKLQIPAESLKKIKARGIKLPTLEDYTNSVVERETPTANQDNKDSKDNILLFINDKNVPDNLIQIFQVLVQNAWETGITLRNRLAGLNHLRAAFEAKKKLLKLDGVDETTKTCRRKQYINWYITSQDKILGSAIREIKRKEKQLLSDYKSQLISLKSVYKRDIKFQQSLLFLGFNDYESILESEFQDQCWLLWLIRCYNKPHYSKEPQEDQFLPDWIHELFTKLRKSTDVSTQDVLNFKPIHDNIMPELTSSVPEVYTRGDWSVGEFVVAAKLLDLVSFVRGKEQECIVVEQEYHV
ncbi:uncharacterized protein LODBEIA_P19030 [Lodderomyces beijingensis]|uniref:SET domain-containing protein n=1 Tax=Lodderomyces beijingensis TaxID=1775926 RepID=A0ABP0ZHP6_9ASCO